MPANQKAPYYTSENFKLLKATERELLDTLPILDKMDACGIECQQQRANLEQQLQDIAKIEQQFFHPPPR